MNNCPFEAVIFDLDGTLLDTALDLALATNHVLTSLGYPPISDETAKLYASDGMRALMKSGIPEAELPNHNLDNLRSNFINFYHSHINERTIFFPNMDKLITALQKNNIPIAIVTSKPDQLTHTLLGKFDSLKNIDVIVGHDTLLVQKPNPAPLYYAAGRLNVKPQKCVYIGDHIRDIEAGNNADMTTVLAAWGYIKPEDKLEDFKANYIAKNVLELATILKVDI